MSDDLKKLTKTLHPYEVSVLNVLKTNCNLEFVTKETKLQDIQAKRGLQWLSNKELVVLENVSKKLVSLDKNGEKYKDLGLPEIRFLKSLSEEFQKVNILEKDAKLEQGEINIVIGTLKRKGAIDITKENKELLAKITTLGQTLAKKESPEELFLKKDFPLDETTIKDLDKLALDNLKSRKEILKLEEIKTIEITLTKKGELMKNEVKDLDFSKFTDTLTPEMLKTGAWKEKEFRHYDVESNVPKITGGKRHFVNQAIEYMKQIWIELGFEEMTGGLCQTGFWDLDTLFVPQDHPARQMQDSFFIKDGKGILKGDLPKKLSKHIKEVHETGGDTGSKGWGGKWSEDFSKEVMLRTHTTTLSAHYINKNLERDENGKIIPKKFFSVNKVFRNETPDWKHLFEFNQVEGIVVDPEANFQHLLGYLKLFFKKMGFTDVRIRPAHFPYTSPSAEVEVYNPKKKQWVELGGAGMFRAEVTKSLIGEEIPVLAWGLGMERIVVEYFELNDLRDLYRNDIKQLKEMKSWMRFSN